MSAQPYTINDVQSDVRHVATLLDIAIEIHLGASATDHSERERIETLLWVARDLACTIDRSVEENHHAL